MANLTTNEDIINDALFRASEEIDGTSDLDARALIYYNRAYRELYMGGQSFDPTINETWWWMKAEASLILDSKITTGSVNVANNSTTVTFSTTPTPTSDSNVTNWFFKVDGQADFYKISSIVTTAGILDSVYTGETAATATYTLFKLDYDLTSSAIKIIGKMVSYQDSEHTIEGMALSEMDQKFPLALVRSGVPSKFAMVDENTIRFNYWGPDNEGDILRIDYDFLELPSDLANDTGTPLVPLQYRHVLSDMTLFYLLADKDETKQEAAGLQSRQGIRSMAQENRARWTRARY